MAWVRKENGGGTGSDGRDRMRQLYLLTVGPSGFWLCRCGGAEREIRRRKVGWISGFSQGWSQVGFNFGSNFCDVLLGSYLHGRFRQDIARTEVGKKIF